VAAFERGAAFEYEKFTELTPAQSGQKPRQTIIPLQHGFGDATATRVLYAAGLPTARDCVVESCVTNRLKFLGLNVKLQTPACLVRADFRERRVEPVIG
jgi:hypothetical protein